MAEQTDAEKMMDAVVSDINETEYSSEDMLQRAITQVEEDGDEHKGVIVMVVNKMSGSRIFVSQGMDAVTMLGVLHYAHAAHLRNLMASEEHES